MKFISYVLNDGKLSTRIQRRGIINRAFTIFTDNVI